MKRIETQRPDNKWMSEGTHIMLNCMQNCTAHCFVAIPSYHSVSYLSFSILNFPFFFIYSWKWNRCHLGKLKKPVPYSKCAGWKRCLYVGWQRTLSRMHSMQVPGQNGREQYASRAHCQHNQRVLAFIRSVIIICCRRIGTFVRIERQWNGTEKNKEKQVTRLIFAELFYCACISCRIETKGEGGGCCFAAVN